ncbi:crossover junction endonuclease EME1 [Gastrophryne carolinensis]
MVSSSEDSDSDNLPRLPFLTTAAPRPVLVLSSDDEAEELPLFRRLAAPPLPSCDVIARPPGGAVPPLLSCDVIARPAGGAAPRKAAARPPAKSSASRDLIKAPQPKRAKKSPDKLTVCLEPGLLQDGSGGLVLSALQALEYHCVIQPQPMPWSITWSRSGEDINGDPFCQQEADMLVLVPGADFIAMVQNSKEEQSSGTLSNFVSHILTSTPCVILTLVVMELEKYFRDQPTKGRKKPQEKVRGEAIKERQRKQKDLPELQKLSRVDVEEVLTVVQLQMNVHFWFLETWKEFSDFVCMFSKALAEAPTKRQRDNTTFSFYLDGDWAGGVRVEKCGRGLLEVWKRQIQQFNRVSVEVASAVVAAYPSPQLLIKAYRRCQSDAERHNLLSDLLVRRGEGVTSTSRRVGPELSKRIYLQLTSLEPELYLDS